MPYRATLRSNRKIILSLVCMCLALNVVYFLYNRKFSTGTPASFFIYPSITNFSSAVPLFPSKPVAPLLQQGKLDGLPVQLNATGKSSSVPLRGLGDSQLPFKDEFSINQKNASTHGGLQIIPSKFNNITLKKILFWNEAYGAKHFGFGFGQEPFLRAGCRVNTCMTTGDRNKYPPEEIDALLWHFRSNDRSLPNKRSPHSRYIFWMMESASYLYGDINEWNGIFNWTFTYKLDSDFPNPYGMVYRRRLPLPNQPLSNYTAQKTKFAAWFVSHCDTISGRRKLVDTLKQWINVDIYGSCGNLQCDRNYQWDTCYKMLERDYKFYFSFENSLCQDYVTEKFFNILQLNIIPVVYGLGRYHLQAPPHSYINALDFPSAKALADYLIYLSNNATAYEEYFRWKRYHDQLPAWEKVSVPWCQLCERLHEDKAIKVYKNLHQWFVQDSNCKHAESPDIQKFRTG